MNKPRSRDLPSLERVREAVREMEECNYEMPDYAFISGDHVIATLKAYDALLAQAEVLAFQLKIETEYMKSQDVKPLMKSREALDNWQKFKEQK